MTTFVKAQGNPKGSIAVALLSYQNINVVDTLNSLGVKTIELAGSNNLQKPVSCHADMLICHIKDDNIFVANGEEKIIFSLKEYNIPFTTTKAKLNPDYPFDVLLNCLYLNGKLFCRADSVDDSIINYCKLNGIEIVDVKQGYSRCSVCVVDEKSAITADSGLAKKMSEYGIDVLQITSGYIELKGYDTGFIGGCAVKLSKDKILFTGKLCSHPDYDRIKDFILSRGIEINECDNDMLVDIGGIAVIKEKGC